MAKYTQGTTLGKQSSRHQFKHAPFNCKVVNHRVVKKIESGRRHGKSNRGDFVVRKCWCAMCIKRSRIILTTMESQNPNLSFFNIFCLLNFSFNLEDAQNQRKNLACCIFENSLESAGSVK